MIQQESPEVAQYYHDISQHNYYYHYYCDCSYYMYYVFVVFLDYLNVIQNSMYHSLWHHSWVLEGQYVSTLQQSVWNSLAFSCSSSLFVKTWCICNSFSNSMSLASMLVVTCVRYFLYLFHSGETSYDTKAGIFSYYYYCGNPFVCLFPSPLASCSSLCLLLALIIICPCHCCIVVMFGLLTKSIRRVWLNVNF